MLAEAERHMARPLTLSDLFSRLGASFNGDLRTEKRREVCGRFMGSQDGKIYLLSRKGRFEGTVPTLNGVYWYSLPLAAAIRAIHETMENTPKGGRRTKVSILPAAREKIRAGLRRLPEKALLKVLSTPVALDDGSPLVEHLATHRDGDLLEMAVLVSEHPCLWDIPGQGGLQWSLRGYRRTWKRGLPMGTLALTWALSGRSFEEVMGACPGFSGLCGDKRFTGVPLDRDGDTAMHEMAKGGWVPSNPEFLRTADRFGKTVAHVIALGTRPGSPAPFSDAASLALRQEASDETSSVLSMFAKGGAFFEDRALWDIPVRTRVGTAPLYDWMVLGAAALWTCREQHGDASRNDGELKSVLLRFMEKAEERPRFIETASRLKCGRIDFRGREIRVKPLNVEKAIRLTGLQEELDRIDSARGMNPPGEGARKESMEAWL